MLYLTNFPLFCIFRYKTIDFNEGLIFSQMYRNYQIFFAVFAFYCRFHPHLQLYVHLHVTLGSLLIAGSPSTIRWIPLAVNMTDPLCTCRFSWRPCCVREMRKCFLLPIPDRCTKILMDTTEIIFIPIYVC